MRVFPGEPYLYVGKNRDTFTLVNVYSQRKVNLPINTPVKFGIEGESVAEISASVVLSAIDRDDGMYVVFGAPRSHGPRTCIPVTVREPADYGIHAVRNIIE